MIQFKNVTKRFGSGCIALDDVSFTVKQGELVLVTGPSGSGKTTLMRLLIKEYEPTSGSIEFFGNPLEKIHGSKVPYHRREVGVVFQDYRLLTDQTVWENIALPLLIAHKKSEEVNSRVTDLLTLVGLTDKAEVFPSQLSGGEAQRVSIARALALAPKVLFADEPTGNLDTQTSLTIAQLLSRINQLGTTILIATHDISVLELLDETRHLHLEKGKIKATHESQAAGESEIEVSQEEIPAEAESDKKTVSETNNEDTSAKSELKKDVADKSEQDTQAAEKDGSKTDDKTADKVEVKAEVKPEVKPVHAHSDKKEATKDAKSADNIKDDKDAAAHLDAAAHPPEKTHSAHHSEKKGEKPEKNHK